MLTEAGPLLLASGSPRRRELLRQLGVPLRVQAVQVDEQVPAGIGAAAYLQQVVEDKAAAAQQALTGVVSRARCPALLVADTIVVLDETILGKPTNVDDARAMITRLAGRAHQVMSRFVLQRRDGRRTAETVVTEVVFRSLDNGDIEAYTATHEGLDKAGAYAIQGIGAALVSRIHGSYSNVVGLPLAEVCVALRQLELWRWG